MEDLCFIDTTVKSKNHNNTVKYINKKILTDGSINTIGIEEFGEVLKNYRTKYNTKLSYGSIKCLFYTMQKERSDWNINAMKKVKNSFWTKSNSSANLYDLETTNKIKDMILYCIKNLFDQKLDKLENYVAMAVLLTVATNLRISEIKQLKKKHLIQIVNGEMINIKIKKKFKGIHLLSHIWLIKKILSLITAESNEYTLVPLSHNFINRKIRQFTADIDPLTKLGIQAIRKVNTTLLIEHCDIETAQIFNRHTKSDTTQKYYNNKTYIGPKINQIMKLNHSIS
ncbi:VLF-1 [Carcinus maenas nudivirus]|uniref:VLF-1 n=1 Tax=Carcinus maenas nudivirus TaxID=2880837 RepID=A0AAE9BZ59_9VIRU|nr:VLF-1 [Carcinus maenas nudivirus]UBZ25632.1 VLF-1 [Carcinus maenas nudivirus]